LAQDDYYYEIQLTNKQLVFYFMAGASGLVLSFLAGIMVGRGVDASAEVQAASRPAFEDKIISEEPPPAAKPASVPPTEDLGYSQRLESAKAEEPTLGTTKPKAPVKTEPPAPTATRVAAVKPAAAPTLPPAGGSTRTASAPPTTKQTASAPAAAPDTGSFALQVGAFKDRGSAESLVGTLKKKGFSAYVVTPKGAEGGLFNVRVGFPARDAAEKAQERLREYNPFIVKL
jgi:cell division septation protein DedD